VDTANTLQVVVSVLQVHLTWPIPVGPVAGRDLDDGTIAPPIIKLKKRRKLT